MTDLIVDIPQVAGAILNGSLVSAVIVAIAFASVRILELVHPPTAATRYVIWTVALVAILALPAVLWILQPGAAPARNAATTVSPAPESTTTRNNTLQTGIAQTNTAQADTPPNSTAQRSTAQHSTAKESSTGNAAVADGAAQSAAAAGVRQVTGSREASGGFITVNLPPQRTRVFLVIVAVWLVVTIVGLARLGAGLVRLEAAKRRARSLSPSLIPSARLGQTRRYRIALSDQIDSPVACGIINPTILLPSDVTTKLSAAELEPVILHEAAHLERYDDLTLLIQRLAECLVFFNPLVWLLSRRMHEDREEACDAWVVARTRRPEAYVRSVQKMIELRLLANRITVVPGMADRTRRLVDRMRLVLEAKGFAKPGVAIEQAAVVVAIVALVVCVTTVVRPLVSFELRDATTYAAAYTNVIRPVAVASSPGPIAEPTAQRSNVAVIEPTEEPQQVTPIEPSGSTVFDAELSPANWAHLFEVAKGISSDGDRARVLRRAAQRIPDHRATYEAFLGAASSIRSSSDSRLVLSELLARDAKENLPFIRLIEASSSVRSSGERSRLLRDLIRQAPGGGSIDEALRAAVNAVPSSGERETLLRELARR